MQLSLIQSKIYGIRSQKVMLDFDLAEMYEVETRVSKQVVNQLQKLEKKTNKNFKEIYQALNLLLENKQQQ